ncbi:dUTP diphosphatase [Kurthia populi]|uniref:dUTP diphosphatase n=1 Tax=Kurthia populi TaxID=1562132 RepID=A0ABW5Y069_9BACL
MKLQIKRLTETAVMPVKAHPTDSGFDLFADEEVVIEPNETIAVSTGIAIALPDGYEAQIRPKSGITSKTDLRVQLGTVDEPYRGEVKVIVDNKALPNYRVDEVNGRLIVAPQETTIIENLACEEIQFCESFPENSILIERGTKIAQMVIAPVAHPEIIEVDELDETDRGANGFGSTGVTAR